MFIEYTGGTPIEAIYIHKLERNRRLNSLPVFRFAILIFSEVAAI